MKKTDSDDDENEHSLDSETDFSKFMVSNSAPNISKMVSFALLFYLYLTIPVQGNFLFRHFLLKHLVLFCSFVFFLFTLRVSPWFYCLLVLPVILSVTDAVLKKKKGYGLNFMIFEVWGMLIGCLWIINLMLIMMDILLFLSNFFGLPVLLFTCTVIAIGNNVAGGCFPVAYCQISSTTAQSSKWAFSKWASSAVFLRPFSTC